MITSSLLSIVRHRAMITPVSRLLATLIHISPSCWTVYRSSNYSRNYSRNGNCPLDWTQIQCSIPGVAKPALCMSRIS